MSVFAANMRHRSFVWQISALSFVLGLLLACAAHTAAQITRAGGVRTRTGFFPEVASAATPKVTQDESEIKKLRERVTELEDDVSKRTGAASTLNKDLQDVKTFAGLTEVAGAGVQVTLTDSKKHDILPSDQFNVSTLIHDSDVAAVVNELKAAGAEAISVNGQRVVSSTPIRCVGPVIQVNGVPVTTPILISVVGDPDILQAALNLPHGVLDEMRRFDPDMAKVEKKPKLLIPAFAGSTQMRYARATDPGDTHQKSDEDR